MSTNAKGYERGQLASATARTSRWRRLAFALLLASFGAVGQDIDGDGWAAADGDCCDVMTAACPHPLFVNPGALEIVGNLVDDDCDPATSDAVAPPGCSATEDFSAVTALQVTDAMELCQSTTANPPLAQRRWGVISANILFPSGATPSAPQLVNMMDRQAAVISTFGSLVPPRGPTMAGLSNGWMRDQNDVGFQSPVPGFTHGTSSSVPADFLAANGGSMPMVVGCEGACAPSQSTALDGINVQTTIRTPTNAAALSYRFRRFVSEFPDFRCSTFTDWHLALIDSAQSGNPADKNIALSANGVPVQSGAYPYPVCLALGCYTCPEGLGPLNLTGFNWAAGKGAASAWETARAAILAGETLTLRWMIFDSGDGAYDSAVLLDDFQWLPEILFGGPLTASFE